MKMNSLLTTPAEIKAEMKEDQKEGYYPCLYLNEKQIKALGLEGSRVGDELTLVAKVRVMSLSEYKGGDSNISLEIVEGITTPNGKAEDALYGKK